MENPIDRDERHPSISDSRSIAAIDNDTLNRIINSIIQTKTNQHPMEGTTQYLLPVDLVVSVDHKSNTPTVRAALPSSFALPLAPPTITSMSPLPLQMYSHPPTQKLPSVPLVPSTLNPSAPTFHPYTPYTPIQPILEQYDGETEEEELSIHESDTWCALDAMEEEETQLQLVPVATTRTPVFKPIPRYCAREYNKNWRNRNKCTVKTTTSMTSMASMTSWRNSNHKPKFECSKPIKLMAEFVKHVTLPNREEYLPSKIYTKTWAMRNSGNVEWGWNVELVYCKGDPRLSLYDRYPVINAQPGQQVEISATIKTSSVPKRYCTYFRLQVNGKFFGPRVWVDIIVGTLDQIKHCGAQNAGHDDKVLPPRAIKWKKKYEAYSHYKVVPVSCQ